MSSPQGLGGKLNSSGGVSPEQMALAQYGFGQQSLGNMQAFAQTPNSTMETQAESGARAKEALTASGMSQTDALAQANFFNQNFGNLAGGLGSILGSIG